MKSRLFHLVKANVRLFTLRTPMWGFSEERVFAPRHCTHLFNYDGRKVGGSQLEAQPVRFRTSGNRKGGRRSRKPQPDVVDWRPLLSGNSLLYLTVLCSLNLVGFPLKTGAWLALLCIVSWKLSDGVLQASLLSQAKPLFIWIEWPHDLNWS